MTSPVLFDEIIGKNNSAIGLVCLNSEKTLNALTLEMVDLMFDKLKQWQANPNIAAVFIHAVGEKAFCAGGDLQVLYQSFVKDFDVACEYAETFFQHEYRLNYLLHKFGKPIICWGHGIVMGGGLGVLAGCNHRVVTERTRIAMPEVTIALFPDVGGSYFLNHMPGECGRFLALTAASINAADSLYAKVADYFISHQQKNSVLQALAQLAFTGNEQSDGLLVSELLTAKQATCIGAIPAANLESHQIIINTLCAGDDVEVIAKRFADFDTDDKWMQRAKSGLAGGSPLAIKWTFHQLALCRTLSLKAVFEAEILLAINIVRHPEFTEGVRALLIDKGQKPQWQFTTLAEVTDEIVESFFKAPWPENPLSRHLS